MSPQDHQKIGYGKQIISPNTPEQLMSNQRLEKSDQLVMSKSIHGSGDRANRNWNDKLKSGNQEKVEIRDIEGSKIMINQEIKIGQDVNNQEQCDDFMASLPNYNCHLN